MDFNQEFCITVTCASGVESVTKNELKKLGYSAPPALNGTLTFSSNALAVARCNLFLRTADRVYILLKTFSATTFDQLFDGVSAIPFEDFLDKSAKITVVGKCVKSSLFAVSSCQSIIKKAIAVRLCKKFHVNSLAETGAEYEINFSIFKDQVTISLNTSGTGLHKRGYRDKVWIAPIKETLASAILYLSRFDYSAPFADVFCGSGTLGIEGARMALNHVSGKFRKFAFLDWNNFPKKAYQTALEEGLDKEIKNKKLEFYCSDINHKAIELAKYHAKRAGVGEQIKFTTAPVKDFYLSSAGGTIVTNPPYGIRIFDRKEAEQCYKDLGEVYSKLNGWNAFVITEHKGFERYFGKKADKNRKLYNSNTECRLYQYINRIGERDGKR